MDRNSQIELESIKTELQSIIDELRDISYGVNRDFDGIGSEHCSASIQKAANHYDDVKSRLNRIDTTIVTDEFRAKQDAEKAAAARAAAAKSVASTTPAPKKPSSNASTPSSTVKSNTTKTSSKVSSKSKKSNDIIEDVVDGIKGAFSWLFK